MLFKDAGTLIINHFSESDGEQTFLIQLREGNFGCRTSMHLNNTNNRCCFCFGDYTLTVSRAIARV